MYPGLREAVVSPRLFAPWSPALFRHAARVLILSFLFQGGALLLPLTTPAQACPSACEEIFYPLTDHLGTATVLLDHNGAKAYEQHFLPFGQKDKGASSKAPSTCNNGQSSDPWPYGFTGHQQDDESGLIYMGARYYHPGIGHFLTPDTVLGGPGDNLSYDRYAYARNNPINLVDPSGNNPIVVAAIIGAILGGASAAASGGNIFFGMLIGAYTGALGAGIVGGAAGGLTAGQVGSLIFLGAVSGALNAINSGGDVLKGAIVGAFGAAAGAAVGAALPAGMDPALKTAVGIMSSGVIGGITSVGMGGKFIDGFLTGAIAAGFSYAAREIAGRIVKEAPVKGAAAGGPWVPEGNDPMPTSQVKEGDKVLVAYTEYETPAEGERQNKAYTNVEPIEANAKKLASQLENKGATANPIEFADAQAFVDYWNNLPSGSYDHVFFLGHNYGTYIAMGSGAPLTATLMSQLRTGVIRPGGTLTWAVCGAATQGSLNYSLVKAYNPGPAIDVTGAHSLVNFNVDFRNGQSSATGVTALSWERIYW